MFKVDFFVPGEPKPQGSKDQFGRESCKKLPAWRNLLSTIGSSVMSGSIPFEGPVSLRVYFTFSRPKGHSNKRGLREDAPYWKQGKPDTDKLLRAIGDGLTGIVVKDDCQIVSVLAEKRYGPIPGANVIVEELNPKEEDILL